jgi:hypothetical protein
MGQGEIVIRIPFDADEFMEDGVELKLSLHQHLIELMMDDELPYEVEVV